MFFYLDPELVVYWKKTTTNLLQRWPPHPGTLFMKYYKYTESVDTFVYCFLCLVPRTQDMHFGMAMNGRRNDTNRHTWRRTGLLLAFIILLLGEIKDQACAELHPHLNKMCCERVKPDLSFTFVCTSTS